MIGILCEKPSAAKHFAEALGGMSGTYNGERYIIAHLAGHCYQLADPSEQVPKDLLDKYKSWDISNLPWNRLDFKFKLKRDRSKLDIINDVKSRFLNCTEICIATDLDPTFEGDLLAMELIEDAGYVNKKQISRMEFLDEEVTSLQKAFCSRRKIDFTNKYLPYEAALYRQRFDFMSMQWTRVATCLVGQYGTVIREGRLKSFMTCLVGDQIDAYNSYKKTVSYQNRFRDDNGVLYINKNEPVVPNKSDLNTGYKASKVVCDGKTLKRKAPPKLMNLSMISAKMSSKGVSADEVLETYQKLYTAKILSYPRTEDNVISHAQFIECLDYVDDVARLLGVDTSILTHRTARSTHVKDGGAHGANRPTKNVPNSLSELVRYGQYAPEIYELVARSFLTMFAEDYTYYTISGHLEDYPEFKGSCNVVHDLGYKTVFNVELDEDGKDLDDTSVGLGTVAEPIVGELIPPRPKYPTLLWLVSQLEKYNVGTGSTISSTYAEISKKSKNSLLSEKKGKISLTNIGELSYKLVKGTNIGGYELTSMVHSNMKAIASGSMTKEECLDKISSFLLEDIKIMIENAKIEKIKGETVMSDTERYTGSWNGREVSFKKLFRGYMLNDAECAKLCAGEKLELSLKKKDGTSTYNVYVNLAEQSFVNSSGKTITYVGPNVLDFVKNEGLPSKFCGHTFTSDEMKLLKNGESVYVEGLYSAAKRKHFNATLKWDDKNNKFEFC